MQAEALFNAEAEEGLLGCALLGGNEILEQVEQVQASDFYITRNEWVWEAMLDLRQSGQAVNVVSVGHHLEGHGRLAEVGGPARLTTLLGQTVNAFYAPQYANVVRADGHKRAVLSLLGRAAVEVHSANGNLAEVTARTAAQLDGLTIGKSESVWAGEAGWAWYAQMQAFVASGEIPGLTTGFPRLDKNTHGLKRKQICVLAGRPSMGKSALAFQIAYRQARAGLKVGILSLEMPKEDVAERIALSECNLDKHTLTAADLERVDATLQTLDLIPLLICDTPGLTPADIGREARNMRRTLGGLDVLVVDHLGHIQHPPGENENLRIGYTMKSLTRTVKELDVAGLVLAQLNRNVTTRAVKEPDLPDLRESGHIENDARQVWMLHREDYYRPIDQQPHKSAVQKAMLLIRKNHNGPRNRGVPLGFIEQSARFQTWEEVGESPDVYPNDY